MNPSNQITSATPTVHCAEIPTQAQLAESSQVGITSLHVQDSTSMTLDGNSVQSGNESFLRPHVSSRVRMFFGSDVAERIVDAYKSGDAYVFFATLHNFFNAAGHNFSLFKIEACLEQVAVEKPYTPLERAERARFNPRLLLDQNTLHTEFMQMWLYHFSTHCFILQQNKVYDISPEKLIHELRLGVILDGLQGDFLPVVQNFYEAYRNIKVVGSSDGIKDR